MLWGPQGHCLGRVEGSTGPHPAAATWALIMSYRGREEGAVQAGGFGSGRHLHRLPPLDRSEVVQGVGRTCRNSPRTGWWGEGKARSLAS